MIFSEQLAEKVLGGRKTVTRRRMTHPNGAASQYRVGKVYAVQPGRGKRHVGHMEIVRAWHEPLWKLDGNAARREGFRTVEEFMTYWRWLHGNCHADEVVAVIEFRVAERCPDCVQL